MSRYGLIELHDLYDFKAPNAHREVVMCKDCKWYSDMWGCTEHDEVYLVTNPDDFCSIGERRE